MSNSFLTSKLPSIADVRHFLLVAVLFFGARQLGAAPPATQPPAPATIQARAKEYLKDGRPADAEKLLKEFIYKQPNAPDAAESLLLIGQAQIAQKRVEDALDSYSSLARRYPQTEWAARALEEQALIHVSRRNPKAAQQLRDELLARHPKSPTTAQVWINMADPYYSSGQFKEALAIYEKIAENVTGPAKQKYETAKLIVESDGNPVKLLAAADVELKRNRPDLAKNIYRLIIDKKTAGESHDEAQVKYAWCIYLADGEESLEAAEKIWSSVAAKEPKSEWGGASRWHLVQLHAGPKQEWEIAVSMCAAIGRDFSPGTFRHEQALFTRAWLLRTHKQWKDAQDAFAELIKFYPAKANHPPIVQYIGEIEAGLTNPSEAPKP